MAASVPSRGTIPSAMQVTEYVAVRCRIDAMSRHGPDALVPESGRLVSRTRETTGVPVISDRYAR